LKNCLPVLFALLLLAASPLASLESGEYLSPLPAEDSVRTFLSFGYEYNTGVKDIVTALLFSLQAGFQFSWGDLLLDAAWGASPTTSTSPSAIINKGVGHINSLGLQFEPQIIKDSLAVGVGAGITNQPRDTDTEKTMRVYVRIPISIMLPLVDNMIMKLGVYPQAIISSGFSIEKSIMFGLRLSTSYFF